MKKLSVILALIILASAITACAAEEADEPLYTTNPHSTTSAKSATTATIGGSDPTVSTTTPSTSDNTPTTTQPTTTTSPTTTSPVTTNPPTTTKPPVTGDSVVVTVQPEIVKDGETYTGRDPLPVISLTVTDPDNKAGLDDTRVGYSFGVAKDGKPHKTSVNHQLYFDEHNYNALTLDTITEEKVLYLTFDNGYEYEGLTGDILDILKEKDVPATFFCTLDYLEDNPEYVVRMINEGHIVGNHTAKHPEMPNVSKERMAQELLGVENYLRANYGYTSPYFRFPSGSYSEEALALVDSLGYRSIFWSSAHADWDTSDQPSVEKTFETITSRLHPGSVILLHAVSQSNTDALADIIDYARAEGYEFRSLDQYPGW